MADRLIKVTFQANGSVSVAVDSGQNPLEVVPGDTVRWEFVDLEGQPILNALIELRGLLPLSRTASIMGQPKGPFTSLLSTRLNTGPFTVADTDRGLYLYVIIRDDRVLNWGVPLFTVGSFSPFFGGIIIRDPPGPPAQGTL